MGLFGWLGDKADTKIMNGCDDELVACRRAISSQPNIQLQIAEGLVNVFQAIPETKYVGGSNSRHYISALGQVFANMPSPRRMALSHSLMKSAVDISKVDFLGGAAVKLISLWINLIDIRSGGKATRNRADNLAGAYEEMLTSIWDAAAEQERTAAKG